MRKKSYFPIMMFALCMAFSSISCGNSKSGQGVDSKDEEDEIIDNSEVLTVSEAAPGVDAAFVGGGLRFKIILSDNNLPSDSVIVCGTSDEVDKETFTGEFVVPAYINCNGKRYKVICMGNGVFQRFRKMTSVSLPRTLLSIGHWAFESCKSLTSVEIPGSVTKIGDFAFAYCSSLTSVTIPNSITAIGGGTFQNCTSLTSVVIPNCVVSIGKGAFSGCEKLKEITSLAVTPPCIEYDTFFGISKIECVLKVPEESVEAYKEAEDWKKFKNIVGI